MVQCQKALAKGNNSSKCGNSEEWTIKINREELCQIKEATFNIILAIEEELKECLKTLTETPRKDEVATTDDVEFYWLIATVNFKIDDQDTR